MGRFTVAYEGRDTLDRRHIEVGALEPYADRLPVFYNYDMTKKIGWAEDFHRDENGHISFEVYFIEDWEDKVREEKLVPTCSMRTPISKTPYDDINAIYNGTQKIEKGIITEIDFGIGANAWGEYPQ
jgi:hypothetical protein